MKTAIRVILAGVVVALGIAATRHDFLVQLLLGSLFFIFAWWIEKTE